MNTINHFWTGTAGNDVYTGEQNDEFLDGWTGNDILAGGLGDDFILGGDGFDAAQFSGDLEDYLFSRSEDGEHLVITGPDGRDTLSAIESLVFDNLAFPIANYADWYPRAVSSEDGISTFHSLQSVTLVDGKSVVLTGSVVSPDPYAITFRTKDLGAQIFDEDGVQLGDNIQIVRMGWQTGYSPYVVNGDAFISARPDGTWVVDYSRDGDVRYGSPLEQKRYDASGNLIETNEGGTPWPIDYAAKIAGLPVEDQSLSVDGTALLEKYLQTSFSYQWRRDGTAVDNANGNTYSLNQTDVGSVISVTVTLIDDNDVEHSFTSDFTPHVENLNDLPEGIVTLDGTLEAGNIITADTSGLSDADSMGALSYQWLRNGVEIEGAGSNSYEISIAEIGQEVTVQVTYTDGFGTLETVWSVAQGVVLPAPDTRIFGTEGADWLAGSDVSQLIEGLAGNDTIMGGGGADLLQGGSGNDLLSGEGTLAASFGLTIANQVFRMYQSALDRTPDAVGHAAWSEKISTGELTLLEVADRFVRSPEFSQTYSNLSNSEFVELLYNNVLNRASDTMGLNSWTEELAQGATRAELLTGFSQSPELINSTTNAASNFAMNNTASDWTDTVYRLYNATLGREPDVGGLTGWSMRLGNGEITLLDATNGFIQSREFRNVYNDLPDPEFVTLLYRNVLDRQPDSGGLARWIEQLENGTTRAEIVLGFSESPQFKTNSASSLEGWMREKGIDDILDAGAGDNTLYGGMLSDTFVFDAAQGGTHLVMDLETWDTLDFRGFGYASDDDIREHMTQVDNDVIFSDQDLSATFVGVDLAVISDAMLL